MYYACVGKKFLRSEGFEVQFAVCTPLTLNSLNLRNLSPPFGYAFPQRFLRLKALKGNFRNSLDIAMRTDTLRLRNTRMNEVSGLKVEVCSETFGDLDNFCNKGYLFALSEVSFRAILTLRKTPPAKTHVPKFSLRPSKSKF